MDEINFEFVNMPEDNPNEYTIVIDNYVVPYIKAWKYEDGEISYSLDRRFGFRKLPLNEAKDFIWFISEAMAVSAGYTSFGEFSIPVNVFQNQYRAKFIEGTQESKNG